MTTAFDPVSGLATALFLLLLCALLIALAALWHGNRWRGRQPPAMPTDDATPLCVRQAEQVARAAWQGKSSWFEEETT